MMNIGLDGIKRKGKLLMGSSDLSFVIYEQKCLHETQAKVLPSLSKAATALLKWSYTESNANIPNLYSCWSDLDHAYQMLIQESIDHSVDYRKVFKDINTEGKKLNDIQKEKESSAKKVTALRKQIESLRKSKKQADKVKLGNLEAELLLAQGKDSETGKLLITKTKEFEECKSAQLREYSMMYCDKSLEALDKLRQVVVAKREVASRMSQTPVYNGDRITKDGMNTVEDVFRDLQLQLPLRDPTLDRTRCFTLGTRSSSLAAAHSEPASNHGPASLSPTPGRLPPRGSHPPLPSNLPTMKPGHTGTLGSVSSSAVYQGGDELVASDNDDSDSDHDYQVPSEEMLAMQQEDLYLAPDQSELNFCPRVPPRTESALKGTSDPSAGSSSTPGDYMEVSEDLSDQEKPRMPPISDKFRSSTDSSGSNASNASSGAGKANAMKHPRVLPSSGSLEVADHEDAIGREGKSKSPASGHKHFTPPWREKEAQAARELEMLKRKPAPLPRPERPDPIKPKPLLKPKPGLNPVHTREKPSPMPRSASSEQDVPPEDPDDSGGIYEDMATADLNRSPKGNVTTAPTHSPEKPHAPQYSDMFVRDEEDSEGDYCVAGPYPGSNDKHETPPHRPLFPPRDRRISMHECVDDDGYTPLIPGSPNGLSSTDTNGR